MNEYFIAAYLGTQIHNPLFTHASQSTLSLTFPQITEKQSRVVAEAQKLVEYEKERDEYWKEQNELALEYASLEKQGLNTKYVYIPKGSRYLARFVRVSIAKTKILNDAKVQYEEQYGKI